MRRINVVKVKSTLSYGYVSDFQSTPLLQSIRQSMLFIEPTSRFLVDLLSDNIIATQINQNEDLEYEFCEFGSCKYKVSVASRKFTLYMSHPVIASLKSVGLFDALARIYSGFAEITETSNGNLKFTCSLESASNQNIVNI
jgi:hypothetical protein